MEFYEAINRRRSIRQFEDKPIPREALERIMDAGLKAPSSNHQRRWELVALTDKVMILGLAKFIPAVSRSRKRLSRRCFRSPIPASAP